VPTHGGRTLLGPLPPAGPVDQRVVHERDDVVVWTSEPLGEDLTVIGTVTAQLALTCSAQQADICVTLCDVHPDGRVLNVVDGNLRTTGAEGESRLLDVRVGSTAMTFRAGHRIALALSASSWPRFDLSPAADYAVDLGLSSLTLPVPEGPR
jgi:putative CocE/NonD family hydrolase